MRATLILLTLIYVISPVDAALGLVTDNIVVSFIAGMIAANLDD